MRIVAVGRIGRGPERDLAERYRVRIRPETSVVECPDGHGDAAAIRRRESLSLLAAVPESAFVVALDRNGDALASRAFSVRLERWLSLGRPLVFLIGGAEGLDGSVLARADATLSFGPQTWPHILARVMLLEQLWRARSIAAGHPYHRE